MSDVRSGLLTDLYQLTMLQGYLRQGMAGRAVFEFFVRKLPDQRHFLVAAGLEQVLDYLETLAFTDEDIAWLASTSRFDDAVLDYLRAFKFTGDVYAVPEGTLCFTNEPLIRVVAPLPAAQLVESRLINILHYQTLIASKAARMVVQAPDRLLIDFGMRRAHGGEAGVFAARAAYLAGFAGSATVLAERDYGVPCYGTVAHSFVQAHDDEVQAFVNYARGQPENAILLIDTYDTVAATRKVVDLAPRLAAEGIQIRGVRLDSGDLAALAREVREIFDRAGLRDIRIFASGSIDECALADMAATGAPIDGYGIGTHLTTSSDVPYLDCAYKLQEYAGVARRKRSTGKATWPGRKQVYRQCDGRGIMVGDTITVEGDEQPGEPLIQQVMKNGRRTVAAEPLADVRRRTIDGYTRLPAGLKTVTEGKSYPVTISPPLKQLAAEVDARTEGEGR